MSAKVKVGVPYTPQRIRELISREAAENLQLQGYVLRYDAMANTYMVVPWMQATGAVGEGDRKAVQQSMEQGGAYFEPLPEIRRRTPEQRLNSLMLKWIEDCKKAGTVPGISDEKIKEIVGAAFVAGKTEITAEVVRTVAAHFLQEAENKRKVDNYKKVTVEGPLT